MIDPLQIKQQLSDRERLVLTEPSLKSAAVLMPYFIDNGREYLVLTVRSDQVRYHKGQIAFPGGNQDPGESLKTTALREAHEEVGIDPADVEILGAIDDIATVTSYRVTPYLGKIPHPYDFQLQETEIAELITVPINALLDDKNITQNTLSGSEGIFSVYYFRWEDYVIWGATGRILAQLLNILYGKDL